MSKCFGATQRLSPQAAIKTYTKVLIVFKKQQQKFRFIANKMMSSENVMVGNCSGVESCQLHCFFGAANFHPLVGKTSWQRQDVSCNCVQSLHWFVSTFIHLQSGSEEANLKRQTTVVPLTVGVKNAMYIQFAFPFSHTDGAVIRQTTFKTNSFRRTSRFGSLALSHSAP